ncbi:MAG TPA: hypothetical protein VMV25_01960 [Steroidobacteraceae bacterium]|nr:hypothetical protein [Steroidobacteraceae bacterium]
MGLNSRASWIVVASVYDMSTANSLAALLNAQLVPAEVIAGSQVIGEARVWEVRVSSAMSERARLLLAPSLLSDAQLNYLATGASTGNDAAN